MRRTLILLGVVALVGLTASAALGASPHLKKGSGISCTFSQTTFPNDTVTCTGTGGLSGLGNSDVTFELSGVGSASYFCKNPGNGTEAKGQNKVPATIPPDTETVNASDIKNGNLPFFGPLTNQLSTTAEPVAASGKDAGCPNNSWTTRVDAIFYTSVTVTTFQGGTAILTCTASNPDGLSGTVALTCS